MAKPQIKNIIPFDATEDHVIEFIWTGDMSYKNRLVIFENDSLASVYDQKITTFDLKHTVPAGTLTNGQKYVAQIQTFDKDDVASPFSDKTIFSALATPVFEFSNVAQDQLVTGSSLVATINYSQENGEPINSYRFYLYNDMKQQISESEASTYQDYISYIYKGFENLTSYYVRCIGVTANGIPLDTGYVLISVYFSNPGDYKLIYATNYPYRGYNTYNTNIKIIDCDDYREDRYQFDNGFIELFGDEITYSDNFNIENDFTLMIRGKCMYQETEIFSATNGENTFEIRSYIYDDGSLRYRLTAHNAGYEYMLYSEAIPKFSQDDIITMWVQRKNNVFAIKVYVKQSNGVEAGMWFGIPNPSNSAEEYEIWINSEDPVSTHIEKEDVERHIQDEEPEGAPQYAIWLGGE